MVLRPRPTSGTTEHTPVRHFLELPVDCFLNFSSLLINIISLSAVHDILLVSHGCFWPVTCAMLKKQLLTTHRKSVKQAKTGGGRQRERGRKKETWSLRNKRRLDRLSEWDQSTQATFCFCSFVTTYKRERVGHVKERVSRGKNPLWLLRAGRELHVYSFPISTPHNTWGDSGLLPTW